MPDLVLYDVEQWVAGILMQLATDVHFESPKDGSLELTLTISKKDLASLIGTTQETLSRKLSFFQEQGWIKLIGQRTIIIVSPDSLKKIISP